MPRVVGTDPGTGSLDLLLLVDGEVADQARLAPDAGPSALLEVLERCRPLDLIAAKLKPGGEFRLGTDDPTYCRWAMMVMNQRRDFLWTAERPADFLERPADWPETRYERKARRHGHEVWYFRYVRV